MWHLKVQPPRSPDLSPLIFLYVTFKGAVPTFAGPQSFNFFCVGHLNPVVCSASIENDETHNNTFLCWSNNSQPPGDLWQYATVRDGTCVCVHMEESLRVVLWIVILKHWDLSSCSTENVSCKRITSLLSIYVTQLNFWRRNYFFFNFSTSCI